MIVLFSECKEVVIKDLNWEAVLSRGYFFKHRSFFGNGGGRENKEVMKKGGQEI